MDCGKIGDTMDMMNRKQEQTPTMVLIKIVLIINNKEDENDITTK